MQINYTPKDVQRFWNKVDRSGGPDACWLWMGCYRNSITNYGAFQIGGRTFLAHRVAYELTVYDIPDGKLVCHHCDNPSCCNPSHLFLGTHLDNMVDKFQKGRANIACGENSGNHKLTQIQVDEIRRRKASGESTRILIEAFGVQGREIRRIVRHERWS